MDYPVLCYGKDCQQPALFKIAARWSDGQTSELKTYGLACQTCLPHLFHDSVKRQMLARTLPGEVGEKPGIYQLLVGGRDSDLVRLQEWEVTLEPS